MILPLRTTLVVSQLTNFVHTTSKKHTHRFCILNVIECIAHKLSGVAGALLKTN